MVHNPTSGSTNPEIGGKQREKNKDCISYKKTSAQQIYMSGSVKSESDGYLGTEVQTFYTCQHSVNHKVEALDHQKMLHAVSAQCTRRMQLNNVKLLAILPSPSVFQRIKGAVVSTADYLLHFCAPVSTDTKREAGPRERETCQLAISRQRCETVNHSVTAPISHNILPTIFSFSHIVAFSLTARQKVP